MKFLASLAALCVFFMASVVFAQPVQDIPPGDDQIVILKKGQPAPYDGQLYSAPTALRWANWLQQLRARLELDVQKEKDTCRVETKFRDSLLTIESSRNEAVRKDMTSRLTRAEEARLKAEEIARNPPFWKTPEFGVLIGAVAVAGVFALSVWAVDSTTAE